MSKMMLYVFTPNVSSSCASPLPGVRADSRRFADRDDGLTFDLLGTCTVHFYTVACNRVYCFTVSFTVARTGARGRAARTATETDKGRVTTR